MDSRQAEKLANWASMGDREAPVAFVGWEPEIDMAMRQLTAWQPSQSLRPRSNNSPSTSIPVASTNTKLHLRSVLP